MLWCLGIFLFILFTFVFIRLDNIDKDLELVKKSLDELIKKGGKL